MEQYFPAPGPTKAEFDALNTKITEHEIKKVTGTLSSTADTSVNIGMPTGWTCENCCIIGFSVKRTNNTWYSDVDETNAVKVYAQGGNVIVTPLDSIWLGMPIVVLLMKY